MVARPDHGRAADFWKGFLEQEAGIDEQTLTLRLDIDMGAAIVFLDALFEIFATKQVQFGIRKMSLHLFQQRKYAAMQFEYRACLGERIQEMKIIIFKNTKISHHDSCLACY